MSYTTDELLILADKFETMATKELTKIAKKKEEKKKKPPFWLKNKDYQGANDKGNFIFPSTHPKVKSGDHFPIDTEGRAQNALSRANQFSSAPEWYKGTLQELLNTVVRAVHKKYPGIKISDKAKKPGKG